MIMVIVSKGNKPDAHVLRDRIEKEFVVERDEIGEIGEISCWKVGWVGRGK